MKTLFIFQEEFMDPKFFVLNGDHSRLNQIYVNADCDERLSQQLYDLIYDEEGRHKLTLSKEFPLNQQPFDHVVVCGFIP